MEQALERAGLPAVTRKTRGDALKQRMVAMGLDASKLARKTGKSRGTINRALAGESSTMTLDHLEVWFDREENKNDPHLQLAPDPAEDPEPARNLVSIRLEEGGTLVVSGPVDTPEDAELLKSITRDLMREWKSGRPRGTSEQ